MVSQNPANPLSSEARTTFNSAPIAAVVPKPPAVERPDPLIELLEPNQVTALSALVAGQSAFDAAEAAGVHRNTVNRWIRSDASFRAALNAWKQCLIESRDARMLRTSDTAMEVVSQAIAGGDVQLAMTFLKLMKFTLPERPGPSDTTLAGDEIAIIREEQRNVLHERADQAHNFTLSPRHRESREHWVEFHEGRKREEAEKAAAAKKEP
jgi:hypothetical protein